jgi:hypothetical protein
MFANEISNIARFGRRTENPRSDSGFGGQDYRREKTYRLFDSLGLYLEIAPSGGTWWRIKYQFGRREKRLSLGVFPAVSLKGARLRCIELRARLQRLHHRASASPTLLYPWSSSNFLLTWHL